MKENKKPRLITRNLVNTFIRKRGKDIHKGDCGRVLIVAGSKGMAGAAVLCATGALRAGAGLVRVSVPEELFPILQISVPEATCITRTRLLQDELLYQAIAIGPGLGEDEETKRIIQEILKKSSCTIVLDADGLNMLKDDLSVIREARGRVIITPHPGEAARLLNVTTDEIGSDRQYWAQRLTRETGAITVLKGAESVVATPAGKTYINTTGNPGMATGGSGDVLTGVIAAFAGQGMGNEGAAVSGTYIHGLAGDLVAEELGEYGLIASDIAREIAQAINTTCLEQSDFGRSVLEKLGI